MTSKMIAVLVLILFSYRQSLAQLGAASLKGPGIAFSMDYLSPSHYIRPQDSVKTASTTAQRRYNFGAGFILSQKIDTASHKVRIWSMGIGASYTSLSNDKYEKTIFPSKLLSAEVSIQHIRNLKNNWSLMGMVSGGIYADLPDKYSFNKDDIFINGGVLFIKKKNSHFSYGFGAMLTNAFGVPMILPGFIMKWQTDDRLRIDVNFPEKLGLAYTVSKHDDLAIALRLRGAAYNCSDRPDSNRLMAFKEISLGLENTWHLTNKVDFVASAGSVLYSGAEFRERSWSDMFRKKPFQKLSANAYVTVGLRWSFQPRTTQALAPRNR